MPDTSHIGPIGSVSVTISSRASLESAYATRFPMITPFDTLAADTLEVGLGLHRCHRVR